MESVHARDRCNPVLFLSSTQVGLDAAGKTTILYKLKLGEIVTTIPTIGKSPPHDDPSPASSEALEIRRPNLPRLSSHVSKRRRGRTGADD